MRKRLYLAEGWTSFFLVMFMLLVVFASLEAGGLAEGLGIVHWIILPGVVLGLILAKLPISPFWAHLAGLPLGVFWTALASLRLIPGSLSWQDKITQILQRVGAWLDAAISGGISADSLVFVIGVALVAWLISYSSAWFIFRTHWVWGAILPAGAICLLNVYYGPPKLIIYFIAYLICAFLLIIRSNVFNLQQEWHRVRSRHSEGIGVAFLQQGAILSILIILLAWLVPSPITNSRLTDVWKYFEEPWQTIQDEFNRLFSSLSYQDKPRVISFGRTMSLGGAVNLDSTPIMDVQAEGIRYLRAVVLDKYTGVGWIDTSASAMQIKPPQPDLASPSYAMRHEVTQTIRIAIPNEPIVYAAPQPIRIYRRARAYANLLSLPSATDAGFFPDVSIIYASPPLRFNEEYVVVSSVSHASVRALRAAGDEYPDWVKERYLQLPPRLPPEVYRLSREITSPYQNAYDKAAAIEAYLRKIRYNEGIVGPPRGKDAVAWFLFEGREGYCDYYASAMVVLCRAVGIPARLARGYALGEYEPLFKAFRIREWDAHAWPEVYFPRYGWIEFEPTSSEPLLVRPGEGEVFPSGVGTAPLGVSREDEDKFGPDEGIPGEAKVEDVELHTASFRWKRIGVPALIIFAVLSALVCTFLYRWHRYFSNLSTIERTFEQMKRYLQLAGIRARSHETPWEYATLRCRLLRRGQEAVIRITSLYMKAIYGPRGLSDEEEAETHRLWAELRGVILSEALRKAFSLLYPSPRPHLR